MEWKKEAAQSQFAEVSQMDGISVRVEIKIVSILAS